MVGLIFKRSDREIRERVAEAPRRYREAGITGYARDPEEAMENSRRHRGSDNPDQGLVLCDDGGKAERDLMDRTLRAHGIDPDSYRA